MPVRYETVCCSAWVTGQGRAPTTISYFKDTAPVCRGEWPLCSPQASMLVITVLAGIGKHQARVALVSSSHIKGSLWKLGGNLAWAAQVYHCRK